MKLWLVGVAAFGCAGCTTLSLERHTLVQGASAAELRYVEVLENLALVAHDPAALPAYSSIFAGTAQVTDTGQLGSTTLWIGTGIMSSIQNGFFSQTATPQVSRSVSENWSLDPLIAPEKIEAMRCACRWVLYGPEKACASCPGLLESPEHYPTPGRHFGVADRLARLPPGWLHVGRLRDVPLTAHYKAHCHGTWVWVMPDGMAGLADFTLVMQDIARVNINSDSLFYWPTPPSVYTRSWATKVEAKDDKGKVEARTGPPILEVSAYLEKVDQQDSLVPGVPYQPTSGVPYRQVRYDNLGADSSLRSQVSAAGAP